MQMAPKWLTQTFDRSVLFLLVGGLLFRCLIAFWLYPGFDEAYYYLYTLHLDWSYFDHPVLVALITKFGPWLTGEVSQFTIRLGVLILHTGSLLLLYLTSAKLFSQKAAKLTLAIATIIPIFQVGFGVLTLPDSPLIFFWSASLLCAATEFFGQQTYCPSYRLSYLGVLVGLACLSKYHGFLLGLGLIGFCLTSPNHRLALRSAWAWLGLGLFVLVIFPILFWNLQHDWVSLRFQLQRGVPGSSYSLLNLATVVATEVAYLFPTLGLPLWWVSLRSLLSSFPARKSVGSEAWQIKLLILWVSIPVIFGFTLLGGYRQILPGWPMPGFWAITLLLGQQAASWQQQSRYWVRQWLKGSAIMVGSLLLFALLHVATGTLQKPSQYALLGGFWSPKDDPSIQLIDVQQLRRGFAASPTLRTALQNSSFIFTNRYYLAGQIGMALYPLAATPITCFDRDLRGFAFWSQADQWLGQDALYITTSRFYRRKDLINRYQPYFSSIQEIGTIPIQRGGVVVEAVHVYQAKKQLKPYPRPYGI